MPLDRIISKRLPNDPTRRITYQRYVILAPGNTHLVDRLEERQIHVTALIINTDEPAVLLFRSNVDPICQIGMLQDVTYNDRVQGMDGCLFATTEGEDLNCNLESGSGSTSVIYLQYKYV